jgi:4-carboxymuconolactone decarboxylase
MVRVLAGAGMLRRTELQEDGMRLSKPRVAPLREEELDDEGREFMETVSREGRVLNIYRTLVAHPKLLKRWGVFGTHVLYKSTLPARERELLILRTGWLCRSGYEWGQHVIIAKGCGVKDAEIERVRAGPDAQGWSQFDAALLRAADELHNDSFISDTTWEALSERFDTQQMIDVIFAVGQYHIVSMALNSLGVQLDEGVRGFE